MRLLLVADLLKSEAFRLKVVFIFNAKQLTPDNQLDNEIVDLAYLMQEELKHNACLKLIVRDTTARQIAPAVDVFESLALPGKED